MCNLLEYSDNYSMTPKSSWNYFRVEVNHSANECKYADNSRINNEKATKG